MVKKQRFIINFTSVFSLNSRDKKYLPWVYLSSLTLNLKILNIDFNEIYISYPKILIMKIFHIWWYMHYFRDILKVFTSEYNVKIYYLNNIFLFLREHFRRFISTYSKIMHFLRLIMQWEYTTNIDNIHSILTSVGIFLKSTGNMMCLLGLTVNLQIWKFDFYFS